MAGITLFQFPILYAMGYFASSFFSGAAALTAKVMLWVMLVCIVTYYMKPCKSAVANISLSFHMILYGILTLILYLWDVDLSVETYTLELMFIVTFLSSHILVAVWAGYALTKHTLTRFGYRFSGLGCKVALSDMAYCVRWCLCRRHRGYQELL